MTLIEQVLAILQDRKAGVTSQFLKTNLKSRNIPSVIRVLKLKGWDIGTARLKNGIRIYTLKGKNEGKPKVRKYNIYNRF